MDKNLEEEDDDCILVEDDSFQQLNSSHADHVHFIASTASNFNQIHNFSLSQLSQVPTTELAYSPKKLAKVPPKPTEFNSPPGVVTNSQPSSPKHLGHALHEDLPTPSQFDSLVDMPNNFLSYSSELLEHAHHEELHSISKSDTSTSVNVHRAPPPPDSLELPQHVVSDELLNALVVRPPSSPHLQPIELLLLSSDGDHDGEENEESFERLQPTGSNQSLEESIGLNFEKTEQSQARLCEPSLPPEATRYCFRTVAARSDWFRHTMSSATFSSAEQQSVFGPTRHRRRVPRTNHQTVAQVELKRINANVLRKRAPNQKQQKRPSDHSSDTLSNVSRSRHSSLVLSSDEDFDCSEKRRTSTDKESESSCASSRSNAQSPAPASSRSNAYSPAPAPRGRPRQRGRRRRFTRASSSSSSCSSSSHDAVEQDPDYTPNGDAPRAPHFPVQRAPRTLPSHASLPDSEVALRVHPQAFTSSSRVLAAAARIKTIAKRRNNSEIVFAPPVPSPIVTVFPIGHPRTQPQPVPMSHVHSLRAEAAHVSEAITISDSDSIDQEGSGHVLDDTFRPAFDQEGEDEDEDELELELDEIDGDPPTRRVPPPALLAQLSPTPVAPVTTPTGTRRNGMLQRAPTPTSLSSRMFAGSPGTSSLSSSPLLSSLQSTASISHTNPSTQSHPIDYSSRNVFAFVEKRFKLTPRPSQPENWDNTP